jgi:glucose/arabinose dehydrogenase
MLTNWTRIARYGLVLAFLAILGSCGGGGGNPMTPAGNATDATPTAPVTPPAPTPTPTPTPPSGGSTQTVKLALSKLDVGLTSPVYATAPAGDNRLFVVELGGRIKVIDNGSVRATPFLDISGRISSDGERGLLSMAFDPQFVSNGYFYIYFTDQAGAIAVERMKVMNSDPNRADTSTVLRIITIAHPVNNNHNGGLVAFGLDGMMYLGIGDGGGAGDPKGNAQNLGVLLGKMLRLDVRNASSGTPYVIPASNPYADGNKGLREIWASGLRNPWRFSFDAPTSLLYIADVGQDKREEINAVASTAAGLNYGWNIMEGELCYTNAGCDKAPLQLPVFDYDHGDNDANGCSITGGMVYRGTAIAGLAGTYLYSDYCKGFLHSIVVSNGKATADTSWPIADIGKVVSFGSDGAGELYMLSTMGIYRIVKQ